MVTNGAPDESTRVTPVPFSIAGLVRTRPAGEAVRFTSSNPSVIAVSEAGVINVSATTSPTNGQRVSITSALMSDATKTTNLTIEFSVTRDFIAGGAGFQANNVIGENLENENGVCTLTLSVLTIPRNFQFTAFWQVLNNDSLTRVVSMGLGPERILLVSVSDTQYNDQLVHLTFLDSPNPGSTQSTHRHFGYSGNNASPFVQRFSFIIPDSNTSSIYRLRSSYTDMATSSPYQYCSRVESSS